VTNGTPRSQCISSRGAGFDAFLAAGGGSRGVHTSIGSWAETPYGGYATAIGRGTPKHGRLAQDVSVASLSPRVGMAPRAAHIPGRLGRGGGAPSCPHLPPSSASSADRGGRGQAQKYAAQQSPFLAAPTESLHAICGGGGHQIPTRPGPTDSSGVVCRSLCSG